MDAEFNPFSYKSPEEGPAEGAGKGFRLDPGGGDFGGGGASGSVDLDAGRRRLDQDMASELDVSGRLNVAVDAPAGTEVKATGGGMFANSVSVDRRMGFEE